MDSRWRFRWLLHAHLPEPLNIIAAVPSVCQGPASVEAIGFRLYRCRFEDLPQDFSLGFRLQVNGKALSLNSSNHSYFGRRRGQNVLHGAGHVKFWRMRYVNGSTDDIFTLQDTDVYQGSEVPSCESDIFLAP